MEQKNEESYYHDYSSNMESETPLTIDCEMNIFLEGYTSNIDSRSMLKFLGIVSNF
jgi:hypothetical protein